jgi:hypothetical protein
MYFSSWSDGTLDEDRGQVKSTGQELQFHIDYGIDESKVFCSGIYHSVSELASCQETRSDKQSDVNFAADMLNGQTEALRADECHLHDNCPTTTE